MIVLSYKCKQDPSLADKNTPRLESWSIKEFGPLRMTIKLNFTNPIYVSSFDGKDEMTMKFLATNLFMAASDGHFLADGYELSEIKVPP